MKQKLARITGDSQTIVEQEIAYAARAWLNYWAFLDYGSEASDIHITLNRYRTAKDKKGVRYCFVEEGPRLDGLGTSKLKARIASTKNPWVVSPFEQYLELKPDESELARESGALVSSKLVGSVRRSRTF